MKQIFMATILVALLLTVSIINTHGIAFAHRYYNSDFQDSQGYTEDQDNTDSSNHLGTFGKTICDAAGSFLGGTLGNAILPGLGGFIGGAAGSKLCDNQ